MKKVVSIFFLFLLCLLLVLTVFSCGQSYSANDQKLLDSLKAVSKPKEPTITGEKVLMTPEGCIVYKLHDKDNHDYSYKHTDYLLVVCPDSVNTTITN